MGKSKKVARKIGVVCRWKPVHLGQAVLLEALANRCEHLLVGLGSSNTYDMRNPFTAAESAEMIRLVLDPIGASYKFIEVPDLGNGPRWRLMVQELFGELDLFVTANAYVRDLMWELYAVQHPATLVPREKHVRLTATMVREAMALGRAWEHMVPEPVSAYLKDRGLVQRFCLEFGDLTVAAACE